MKTISKIIVGTIFLCLTVSCNNALDRSIAEPLTTEEVNEAMKKDPGFVFTYKFVESHNNYLQTTSQKSMWKDLTYKRFHKFVVTITDGNFLESHEKEFAKKWELQYGHCITSADSVCDIWEKYWDTHRVTNYVRVDLVDIEKEYIDPPWRGDPIVSARNFVMKVIPLLGTVDGVSFDYNLLEKDEENVYSHHHSVEISDPFNAPVVVRDSPVLKTQIDEIVKSSDFNTVLSEYKFAFAINYVIINGKKVSTLTLREATPDAVYKYIWERKKGGNKFEKEFALKSIVENILKKEFESKDDYVSKQVQNACSEIDELAFRFFSL